jgi:hypothetical protein
VNDLKIIAHKNSSNNSRFFSVRCDETKAFGGMPKAFLSIWEQNTKHIIN